MHLNNTFPGFKRHIGTPNDRKKQTNKVNQVQTSKTSERKTTRMSNFFHLFLFSAMLSLGSCQGAAESQPEPVPEDCNPVEHYLQFLRLADSIGINNHTQLLAYIDSEEQHFNRFLDHIAEYQEMDLTELTLLTELICQGIYLEASAGNLDSIEVRRIMTCRSNRRLIRNAQVGYELLKVGQTYTQEQTHAYLWMMLQPFYMLDSVAVSMLTGAEREQLQQIANETPTIIDQLSSTK